MLALTDSQELEGWKALFQIQHEERERDAEIAQHGEVHDPRRQPDTDDEEEDDEGEWPSED